MNRIISSVVFTLIFIQAFGQAILPDGFCYADEKVMHLKTDLRYHGMNNFLGRQVKAYENARAIMTCAAAEALDKAARELAKSGLGFIIYDAYRPQTAVNDFVQWAQDDKDTIQRRAYYPRLRKNQLFPLGYISSKSAHTRGSTIDLGLYYLESGEVLDMGSPFDFFGVESHHDYTVLSKNQKSNRKLLKNVMSRYGFRSYEKEWWHYTLRKEPFPYTSFDFPVK